MTTEELKLLSDNLKKTVDKAISEFITETSLVPIVQINYIIIEGYGCAAEKAFPETKVSIQL